MEGKAKALRIPLILGGSAILQIGHGEIICPPLNTRLLPAPMIEFS